MSGNKEKNLYRQNDIQKYEYTRPCKDCDELFTTMDAAHMACNYCDVCCTAHWCTDCKPEEES